MMRDMYFDEQPEILVDFDDLDERIRQDLPSSLACSLEHTLDIGGKRNILRFRYELAGYRIGYSRLTLNDEGKRATWLNFMPLHHIENAKRHGLGTLAHYYTLMELETMYDMNGFEIVHEIISYERRAHLKKMDLISGKWFSRFIFMSEPYPDYMLKSLEYVKKRFPKTKF